MVAHISALLCWFACRFQNRLELELEVIALRHQVAVLHRRHSGARRFVAVDRLLWVIAQVGRLASLLRAPRSLTSPGSRLTNVCAAGFQTVFSESMLRSVSLYPSGESATYRSDRNLLHFGVSSE